MALSTFGAVNGILLTSSRLFYAGANEGQMPEILTMIQIHRFTPTPAVLAMALLSMLYLTVSDIFALINYVGFATWVSNLSELMDERNTFLAKIINYRLLSTLFYVHLYFTLSFNVTPFEREQFC